MDRWIDTKLLLKVETLRKGKEIEGADVLFLCIIHVTPSYKEEIVFLKILGE